mgnify:CR=1 FL=1
MNHKRYDPLKILFVEDEKGTRERVSILLERRFTNVLVAENGQDGWDKFQFHAPDVVITDLNLPDISGLALIEEIRKINNKTAILIITAYNESEYLLQAIELGVSNFLIKPLNIEKLDKAMDKIHQLFTMETELERQRQYVRTVLDFQESLVIVTDGQQLLDANHRFERFFNLSLEENPSVSLKKITSLGEEVPAFHEYQEDDWEKLVNGVKKVKLTDHESGQVHYFNIKADQFPNQPEIRIISFTDVTELENERQYYKNLAIIDPLTQIYNRIQFNRSLSEEIQKAKRYHSVFALLMFDIDHFKKINDTYGHQLGDKILIELTDVVKKNIREVDIFARFGGEEFIILTPETDLDGAEVVAEKLRKEIEAFKFSHGDQLTCSFGVSMYKKGDQPDDLIKRVDDRLYMAKNRGRNQVCASSEC